MSSLFLIVLRLYAICDIILSVVSSVGWYIFWRLVKFALFVQRYDILKQSPEEVVDGAKEIQNTESDTLAMKQRVISEFCGTDVLNENIYQSIIRFEDIVITLLAPITLLCALSMFGFFLGGILLGVLTFTKSPGGVKAVGFVTLIAEGISITVLLIGSLLILDKRLCATEYVGNVRLYLLGSVFVVLVLYKFYEIIMIIQFIRGQSARVNSNSATEFTQMQTQAGRENANRNGTVVSPPM